MVDIDITKAADDLANEKLNAKKAEEDLKISELEEKLKAYQEKEEAQRLAEEEARKEELHKRLEKLEAESKAKDEVIGTLSTRMSNAGIIEDSEGITDEEYKKNREKYDTMALKDMLPGVFNR